jgi:hypothetical protein
LPISRSRVVRGVRTWGAAVGRRLCLSRRFLSVWRFWRATALVDAPLSTFGEASLLTVVRDYSDRAPRAAPLVAPRAGGVGLHGNLRRGLSKHLHCEQENV